MNDKLYTFGEINKCIDLAIENKDVTIEKLKEKVKHVNNTINYLNLRQKVFIDECKRQKGMYVPKEASLINLVDHPKKHQDETVRNVGIRA